MKKLFACAVLLSMTGCVCTGAKVAARHTMWNDGTPTTIELETDLEFKQRPTRRHRETVILGPRHSQ